jgi:hypothetical protein
MSGPNRPVISAIGASKTFTILTSWVILVLTYEYIVQITK